ncbi:MAG: excinuclease ABC subunit B, partial [bacterium]|nr:excinuclease ABC subunit B [bacterium]
DSITNSMRNAIYETERRRVIQKEYNREHNITPMGIRKKISPIFDYYKPENDENGRVAEKSAVRDPLDDIEKTIHALEKEMRNAAKALEFETAAELRDQVKALKKRQMFEF